MGRVSPSGLLDWFYESYEEDEEGDEEYEQDENGWGELSFAFGVGSLEYAEWGEKWGVEDCEWNKEGEIRGEETWDLVSTGFSDWEEVEDN